MVEAGLMQSISGFEGGGTETDVVFVRVLGFHGSLINYVGCGALSWQWAFLVFPAIAGVCFFVGVTINYFAVVCFYPCFDVAHAAVAEF